MKSQKKWTEYEKRGRLKQVWKMPDGSPAPKKAKGAVPVKVR
jgi:hypothetical protein